MDDVESCWARGFLLEEELVSWAIWRGPVALRPSLPADSIVDSRAAAAGRAARAPGRSAAQRPFGLGTLVSGRDAAASRALNAATWCGAARALWPLPELSIMFASALPGRGNSQGKLAISKWRGSLEEPFAQLLEGDVWGYANRYFAARAP